MWQSLIGAELRRECWTAIEDVERRLVAHIENGERAVRNPMLASGDSGLALFFAYLDAARPGSDAGERALEVIGHSLDSLAEIRLLPALYAGFTGVGWVVEHLTRELYEADDELAGDVDDALHQVLASRDEKPLYELVLGLSGFGMYCVERLPHPRAAEAIARIVGLLAASAEESDAGVTWFTPPGWLTDGQREWMPEGCYNLGVAHGVPGVIGFLAAAHREGANDPRIVRLADGAVRWLLAQKLPAAEKSLFPAFVVPGVDLDRTRTAWCYGDLGVAAVVLSAARSFGRPEWEAEALALARTAARRAVDATGVVDAGLCHGAAGLAHLFNRFHQSTGDAEMKDAALAWYRRALTLPCEGEHGFLTGLAGYGLAMLAAASEVEPAWDRVLLVS